ncbi:MAG TPA: hypothetical protein VKG87_08160 [Terriglobales bacterium]|nr:hypothetical protein [Terriglobales bacterium]
MIEGRYFADNLLMHNAKTTLNMIRAALIFAIAAYMFIGEKLATGKAGPANTMLFQILAIIAVLNVVVILIIRRNMVRPSLAGLASNAGDGVALNRWRVGYVITYALCEAVALYGFILRIMGFSFRSVAPFYLASIILMIFFAPRTVEGQSSSAAVAQ